jgi:hypothetical protein
MNDKPRISTPDIIFFIVSGLAAVAALMLALRAIESGNTLVAGATLVIAVAIEVVCWMYWMRYWRKR